MRIRKILHRLLSTADHKSAVTEQSLTISELQRLLGEPASRALTFLEIGANDGRDTQRFLTAFPSVTVHAFEPEPRAQSDFRTRIRDRRAVLHEIALGSHDGRTSFFRSGGAPPGRAEKFPDGWHKSGSIRQPTEHRNQHPWCTFDEVIEVPLMRLDTWSRINAIEEIDFIWMDVQGAEGDVIAGGTETFSRSRYLYTEYSNTELYEGQIGLGQILAALPGWEIVKQFPNDVLLQNTRFERA